METAVLGSRGFLKLERKDMSKRTVSYRRTLNGSCGNVTMGLFFSMPLMKECLPGDAQDDSERWKQSLIYIFMLASGARTHWVCVGGFLGLTNRWQPVKVGFSESSITMSASELRVDANKKAGCGNSVHSGR